VAGKDADESEGGNDEEEADCSKAVVTKLFVDLGHEVLSSEIGGEEDHEADAQVDNSEEVSLTDFFKRKRRHHLKRRFLKIFLLCGLRLKKYCLEKSQVKVFYFLI